MKTSDAEQLARDGYAVFRGEQREDLPPHWDDLSEERRLAFVSVAKWVADLAEASGFGGLFSPRPTEDI